jgi:hypothetical protein
MWHRDQQLHGDELQVNGFASPLLKRDEVSDAHLVRQ